MEICDKKQFFGDKSTFGSSKNSQNISKKSQQAFFIFCTLHKGRLPTLSSKKIFAFCKRIRVRNIHMLPFSKIEHFLNKTEYKIFLIKSFLKTY